MLIDPGTLADIERLSPPNVRLFLTVLDFNDDRVPTTYSWNLTLSHRLPGKTILEASYVGNSSHNQLNGLNNLNAVPEGAMFGFPKGDNADDYRRYLSYGNILQLGHDLTQNYNSLQVTFNRQSGRINYAGSYTFAKTLGTSGFGFGPVSDNFDIRGRSYGVLEYDRTHTFSIAYNILLPGHLKTRVLREVINGWQVSGISQVQSGAPLRWFNFFGTMANGEDIGNPVNVAGTPDTWVRLQLTCDPREGLAENQFANPNCFAAPSPGHNGTYQLPYMKNPYFQNHDLSIFKNFILDPRNEVRKLQLRFSAYNFLNHPNQVFYGNDPGLALSFNNGVLDQDSLDKFGRVTQKRGRRLLQFAIKFTF